MHDASKQVRKASTSGDECSCSGHVDEQNQLQREATASRDHRQLAKPEQEAGTAAAAGQVHRQPEQQVGTPASASFILQQKIQRSVCLRPYWSDQGTTLN